MLGALLRAKIVSTVTYHRLREKKVVPSKQRSPWGPPSRVVREGAWVEIVVAMTWILNQFVIISASTRDIAL